MVILRGVKKSFRAPHGMVRVLDGIDLEIAAGEFVAVAGPSGCGKSTLLSVIGLLSEASKGEVVIGGRSVREMNERERTRFRAERVGFVFQFPSLVNTLNARENVLLPKLLLGGASDADRRRADFLLDEVGLSGRGDARSYELSGGEQRRVALARALMNDPQLLLADEPTGALDRETGQEILNLLQSSTKNGKTVVMVSHDREALGAAHRALMLRNGVIM